jgi:hypothetical protein
VASLPAVPVVAVRAALDAPRAAREHPCSRELRRRLDDGYTVTGYQPSRGGGVHVSLRRGSETCEVASPDLAFVAYAARAVPRAVGRATEAERRRVLGRR